MLDDKVVEIKLNCLIYIQQQQNIRGTTWARSQSSNKRRTRETQPWISPSEVVTIMKIDWNECSDVICDWIWNRTAIENFTVTKSNTSTFIIVLEYRFVCIYKNSIASDWIWECTWLSMWWHALNLEYDEHHRVRVHTSSNLRCDWISSSLDSLWTSIWPKQKIKIKLLTW